MDLMGKTENLTCNTLHFTGTFYFYYWNNLPGVTAKTSYYNKSQVETSIKQASSLVVNQRHFDLMIATGGYLDSQY